MSVTFFQRGQQLAQYEFPADSLDAIRQGIHDAHDQFRTDLPDVSMFDQVSTVFDKAD